MKRILSLILAAALLAPALVSCEKGMGEGESANETELQTTLPETDAAEAADAPITIAENGTAMANILLSSTAGTTEQFAAQELAYHVSKVSGTTLSVANDMNEGGPSVVIATPEPCPSLKNCLQMTSCGCVTSARVTPVTATTDLPFVRLAKRCTSSAPQQEVPSTECTILSKKT